MLKAYTGRLLDDFSYRRVQPIYTIFVYSEPRVATVVEFVDQPLTSEAPTIRAMRACNIGAGATQGSAAPWPARWL